MKFTKLPLPTTDIGVWMTTVLSMAELVTIYDQAKNGEIDGIMLVDGPDYGGIHEQKALSTGFTIINSTVIFHFSYSYYKDGSKPIGEGFVNKDQTRAMISVSISSTGILYYRDHDLNNLR